MAACFSLAARPSYGGILGCRLYPIEPFAAFKTQGNVMAFAKQMQAELLSKGVAIGRPFPPLNTMIRVSIGTDAEMVKFRKVFTEVMAS